jgi:DNA-binding transcriptional LysR family regulator
MMENITNVNLSAIDLNLLLVLSTVLDERSVTRAACRLHVTQSAVSNALARLRDQLGDPLLVRSGRGLAPTPFAVRIGPGLAAALGQLSDLVGRDPPFDPATSTRRFTLACADNAQLSDLPRLSAALAAAMPRAALRVVSIDTLLAGDGLTTGEVDVAIAPSGTQPGLCAAPLYRERAVGVLRRGHRFRGRRLTRRAFAEIPQVDLHLALGRAGVGNALAGRAFAAAGLSRAVSVTVPSFAAAALVAATSDRLVCMPHRVATVLAGMMPLRIVELPVAPLVMELALVWHRRTDVDPEAAAFRAVVLGALAEPRPGRGGRAASIARAARRRAPAA